MLLIVFRSVVTTIVILLTVAIELQVARGIVAFLGLHGFVGLTTFVVNLLVSLGIAAGTDYAVFFFGRYKRHGQAGEDRETAYYTTYRGVAQSCPGLRRHNRWRDLLLEFHQVAIFSTLGSPRRAGDPGRGHGGPDACSRNFGCRAAVSDCSTRKRQIHTRGWRRVGTAIVRWPAPILVATVALSLIGLLTLPGYNPSYNDQKILPQDIPANMGYTAAARHFPESR